MWSTAKFLDAFKRVTEDLVGTVERKNADYAGKGDPFHNFMLAEWFSKGRISAEDGVLVRMTDKLSRAFNLVTADPQVVGESFEDTAYDLAAYAIILGLLRRSRTEPDEFLEDFNKPVEPVTLTEEQKSAVARLREFLMGGGAAVPA